MNNMAKVRKFKKTVIAVLGICLIMFAVFTGGGLTAYAESPVSSSDGTYSVPVNLDGLKMGADNFSSSATVEKSDENYYMTFGHSSSISNLVLESGNKQTGYTVKAEGGWTYYTYTLSAERLSSELSFSAYINAMSRNVNLTVKLNLSGATRTGDYSYEGERPAEYVPVIQTTAGDTQMEKGATYVLPTATAALGDEVCEVTTKVFYGGEEVALDGNRFTLENAGEYTVIYRAESSAYKTNLGNNSYSEYAFTVVSKVGATVLAKFEDESGALSSGTAIQASNVTVGTTYELATDKMKTIADNFSVMSISYFAEGGEEVTPGGNVTLYLMADMTYDRNEIVVYHLSEDGELTKIDCSGYGRYVRLQTDKTGTFIICIPGVASVMPMWGYALILVACVLVLAAGITLIIILVRKKKKRKANEV